MYSREFSEPPKQIIQKGKAEFGTYEGVSAKIDIKGMRAPYAGIPLPHFISSLRIKSRLNYAFSLDKFIGLAAFIDFKFIGLGEKMEDLKPFDIESYIYGLFKDLM